MKNFNFWKISIFEKFKFRIGKFQFLKNFYSDWKNFLFRILKNFYLWKILIQNWKITIQNWKFFLFRIEKISIFEKFLFRIKKFPFLKILIQNWKISIVENFNSELKNFLSELKNFLSELNVEISILEKFLFRM